MTTPVQPETPIQRCLREMREKIKRIEESGIPTAQNMAMALRHQMIELTSLVNDLQASAAAKRMTGEAEQLKPQVDVMETPLFQHAAAKAAPSAEDLERRMQQAHWREADHTNDREDHAA